MSANALKPKFGLVPMLATVLRTKFPGLAKTLRANCPGFVARYWLKSLDGNRMTLADYQAISSTFEGDRRGQSLYLLNNYHARAIIDAPLIRIMQRFRDTYGITQMLETGTYDGDTSFAASFIFDKVYTCDVVDYQRRPEFYYRENIVYELRSSTDFLHKRIDEIQRGTLFYLDTHWEAQWALRDDLEFIFAHCERPIIIIDDFKAGNGLEFVNFSGIDLDFSYLEPVVPHDYSFFVNSWSNRNKGLIFLFPTNQNYGCPLHDNAHYDEHTHGLWEKV
jgi:hypothetical protein